MRNFGRNKCGTAALVALLISNLIFLGCDGTGDGFEDTPEPDCGTDAYADGALPPDAKPGNEAGSDATSDTGTGNEAGSDQKVADLDPKKDGTLPPDSKVVVPDQKVTPTPDSTPANTGCMTVTVFAAAACSSTVTLKVTDAAAKAVSGSPFSITAGSPKTMSGLTPGNFAIEASSSGCASKATTTTVVSGSTCAKVQVSLSPATACTKDCLVPRPAFVVKAGNSVNLAGTFFYLNSSGVKIQIADADTTITLFSGTSASVSGLVVYGSAGTTGTSTFKRCWDATKAAAAGLASGAECQKFSVVVYK